MSKVPRQDTILRTQTWNRVLLVFSAILLLHVHGYAQSGPMPPCGTDAVPTYPALDETAAVKSWSKAEFGLDWRPPACTGWTATGFTTMVTTVARFRHTTEAQGLLRQIGAISELAGMRYWSITHKRWRTLIVDAHAVTSLKPNQPRADFAPDEMKEGNVLYFEQSDNLSGQGIYQVRILAASADRVVIDVENVSTMRYLMVTVLPPGEMQSIYFLNRESENVWRFYSIVRIGKNANQTLAGKESSAINRAVAFYRHMVGIPSDQEPPAAR